MEHFFGFNSQTIAVYICDSSDKRQLVRQRKFEGWFNYFKGTDYIKMDESIKDLDGIVFPISLIIKRSNPFRTEIFEAFTKMVEGYNHDK